MDGGHPMTTAIYNTSDDIPAKHRPRSRDQRELDVEFAAMMEAAIARQHGVGSPEHRAAVHALDTAKAAA